MRISENSRKTLYIILGILLLSVCSLTIVYAALNAVLRISGNSEIVASTWDIHLDNPEVKSGSVNSSVPTISGNNLSFAANLTKPGDYYEFSVDVVNDGTIDAMIDSVVKTPNLTEEQVKYINYEITYENGESISTNQTLKKGTSTPIKVRVEYRKDLVASDLPSSATELNLKLTLIYVQSDGTGSEIINNGVQVVSVVSGDGTYVGNELCIKEECFYVISSTDSTVTMLSKYNLLVGNSVDKNYNVTPLASPTGIQDKTAVGYSFVNSDNGDFPFIGTTEFSNVDATYAGSVVEKYVNDYSDYLTTQGVTPEEARLITKDELINLGCSEVDYSCSSAPSWVYATTYWTGTASAFYYEWCVYNNAYFGSGDIFHADSFGVRPVITISRDYL